MKHLVIFVFCFHLCFTKVTFDYVVTDLKFCLYFVFYQGVIITYFNFFLLNFHLCRAFYFLPNLLLFFIFLWSLSVILLSFFMIIHSIFVQYPFFSVISILSLVDLLLSAYISLIFVIDLLLQVVFLEKEIQAIFYMPRFCLFHCSPGCFNFLLICQALHVVYIFCISLPFLDSYIKNTMNSGLIPDCI